MKRLILGVAVVATLLLILMPWGVAAEPAGQAAEVRYVVTNRVMNPVDDRLFGQFLEIASWGEPGPDAVVDPDTGDLPADIIELLEWMQIPIIRFPGGTDIDRVDWTDRIAWSPTREAIGPIESTTDRGTLSNRFTYDAFLGLCERLGAEPLLVVNLKEALEGERSVEQVAAHAAALVAYCNMAVDDPEADDQLRLWAEARQRNGRAEPWNVKTWQVGNEAWVFLRQLAEKAGHTEAEAQVDWAVQRVVAVADAMLAVDPELILIFDGKVHSDDSFSQLLWADERMNERFDLLTLHAYFPMNTASAFRGETELAPAEVGDSDVWYAALQGPGRTRGYEQEAFNTERWPFVGGSTHRLAVTEWNWNAWGKMFSGRDALHAQAQGLGAAAFLHGMMRQGDRIELATQSMLVGTSWHIAALHADAQAEHPPYLSMSGLVTGLYSRHHGGERLEFVAASSVPALVPAVQLKRPAPVGGPSHVPLIDAVATRSETALYLHLVHRGYEQPMTITVDLSGLDSLAGEVQLHRVEPRPADAPGVEAFDAARKVQADHDAQLAGGQLRVELPPRSVSVVVLPWVEKP